MAICPICGAEAKPRSQNPSFPFCTARCKTVDLGKWMDEEYRVPGPSLDHNDSSEDEDSADEIVRH